MADVPKFDAAGCRYDQSTYGGRLQHFREMTSPATLLVSDDELAKAQDLLARHKRGEAAGATDAELWEAKRIRDAIIHPVTGEKMFLPGRMSAFVPSNTIPTAGMLCAPHGFKPESSLFHQYLSCLSHACAFTDRARVLESRPRSLAKTPLQVMFWQWMNQSVNVMTNYVNRSGGEADMTQVASAYALAVGVSCSIAVGARKIVQSGPSWVKALGIAVPYAAVVSAGAANVAFTRMPEMQEGAPIAAPDGTQLGKSKAAARSAVANTIFSRCMLLPIAPMLLPPIANGMLQSAVALGPIAAAAAETCFVAGSIYGALPFAIAVFPQEMKVDVNQLEPEFQGLKGKDGTPIGYVLCNKGL